MHPKPQNPKAKPNPPTDEQKATQEEMLSEWLNKSARIVMTDDRVLQGQIICIDGQGNLILQNVIESRHKVCCSSTRVTY